MALDSRGDRIESYEVMNYVVEEGDVMHSVPVGRFNSTLGQYKACERAVIWPGNTTTVPVDYLSGRQMDCNRPSCFETLCLQRSRFSSPCSCL